MNTHINRHIGREKHAMQNSIITVVFYLHDYKTSNVVESNWFLCWGSSGGAGTIRESGVIGQSRLDLSLDCAVIGQTSARPAHGWCLEPAVC